MEKYDIAVLGAGIAGLSAGMWAARYGLKTVVIDRMGAGGQIVTATRIDNLPGLPQGVSGYDLGPLAFEQAEAAGAEFRIDDIETITPAEAGLSISCGGDAVSVRAVIVALGSAPRTLGVPGEEEFAGRGISHCASCDGPLYAGKAVVVIGGGDTALDEALVLADSCSSVLVLVRGGALRAQPFLIDQVQAKPNIDIRLNTHVERIAGESGVTHVVARGPGGSQEIACHGVFICAGTVPNTALLQGLVTLDANGHIETDVMMRTSHPAIFAVGDIRSQSVGLLAACAGDGATAATAAWRTLKTSA
ncbi:MULTISPECIES: FAD-dependent oxidoreductase [unclassified Beijerinckia]|uniref:NAD(P)/FAD-dependent oxidoreductase n=1 Tax=unclassified Beijerinckia TaxID=2638183 RepID=UPI00089A23AF|nr:MULTISPECIES: FAD-dependent oxidoreductase [unclassified Beijerinckia]MDH7796623.1 thioredoxin reductase (NADPH) [Beijerinckia sp. GAS462]SEC53018.1 thioredoxin reductase (NADPH) [Beijerinckia sp. 28-YEA-48]